MKKLISLLLCFAMLVSLFPAALAADGADAEGAGEEPIIVSEPEPEAAGDTSVQEEPAVEQVPEQEDSEPSGEPVEPEALQESPHVHDFVLVPATETVKEHYVCSGCDALFILDAETEEYIEVNAEDLAIVPPVSAGSAPEDPVVQGDPADQAGPDEDADEDEDADDDELVIPPAVSFEAGGDDDMSLEQALAAFTATGTPSSFTVGGPLEFEDALTIPAGFELTVEGSLESHSGPTAVINLYGTMNIIGSVALENGINCYGSSSVTFGSGGTLSGALRLFDSSSLDLLVADVKPGGIRLHSTSASFSGCNYSDMWFIGELTDENYLELLAFVRGKGFNTVQLGVPSGTLNITSDCNIPSGVELYNYSIINIAEGVTVSNGGSITNTGVININGSLLNYGTVTNTGSGTINGSYSDVEPPFTVSTLAGLIEALHNGETDIQVTDPVVLNENLEVPEGIRIEFLSLFVNSAVLIASGNTSLYFTGGYSAGEGSEFVLRGDPDTIELKGIDNSQIELYAERLDFCGIAGFFDEYSDAGYQYLICTTIGIDFSSLEAWLEIPSRCVLRFDDRFQLSETFGEGFYLSIRPDGALLLPSGFTLTNNGTIENFGLIGVMNEGSATIANYGSIINFGSIVPEITGSGSEDAEASVSVGPELDVNNQPIVSPFYAYFLIDFEGSDYFAAHGYKLGVAVSRSDETDEEGMLCNRSTWDAGSLFYGEKTEAAFIEIPFLNPGTSYYYQAFATDEDYSVLYALSDVHSFTTPSAEPGKVVELSPGTPAQLVPDESGWLHFSFTAAATDMYNFAVSGGSHIFIFNEDGSEIFNCYQEPGQINSCLLPVWEDQKVLINVRPDEHDLTFKVSSAAAEDVPELHIATSEQVRSDVVYRFTVPAGVFALGFILSTSENDDGGVDVFNPSLGYYEFCQRGNTCSVNPRDTVYIIPRFMGDWETYTILRITDATLSEDALRAAIDDAGLDSLDVRNSLEINGDLAIPEGFTLRILGGSFTVNGDLTNNGRIEMDEAARGFTVTGTFFNNSSFEMYRQYILVSVGDYVHGENGFVNWQWCADESRWPVGIAREYINANVNVDEVGGFANAFAKASEVWQHVSAVVSNRTVNDDLTIPAGCGLTILYDWENNCPGVLTVPEMQELTVSPGADIWMENGCRIDIYQGGTLRVYDAVRCESEGGAEVINNGALEILFGAEFMPRVTGSDPISIMYQLNLGDNDVIPFSPAYEFAPAEPGWYSFTGDPEWVSNIFCMVGIDGESSDSGSNVAVAYLTPENHAYLNVFCDFGMPDTGLVTLTIDKLVPADDYRVDAVTYTTYEEAVTAVDLAITYSAPAPETSYDVGVLFAPKNDFLRDEAFSGGDGWWNSFYFDSAVKYEQLFGTTEMNVKFTALSVIPGLEYYYQGFIRDNSTGECVYGTLGSFAVPDAREGDIVPITAPETPVNPPFAYSFTVPEDPADMYFFELSDPDNGFLQLYNAGGFPVFPMVRGNQRTGEFYYVYAVAFGGNSLIVTPVEAIPLSLGTSEEVSAENVYSFTPTESGIYAFSCNAGTLCVYLEYEGGWREIEGSSYALELAAGETVYFSATDCDITEFTVSPGNLTYTSGNAVYALDYDAKTAVITGPAEGFSGELVMLGMIQTGDYDFIVTGIADGAFENSSVESVSFDAFPNNASFTIGARAFAGCASLTAVNLPACMSVSDIGSGAFSGCSSLTDLSINGSPLSLTESIALYNNSGIPASYTVQAGEATELYGSLTVPSGFTLNLNSEVWATGRILTIEGTVNVNAPLLLGVATVAEGGEMNVNSGTTQLHGTFTAAPGTVTVADGASVRLMYNATCTGIDESSLDRTVQLDDGDTLGSVIADLSTHSFKSCAVLVINADASVTEDLTIPAGYEVVIMLGNTLTVESEKVLTNSGKIRVGSSEYSKGTLCVEGTVVNCGVIDDAFGEITGSGTIITGSSMTLEEALASFAAAGSPESYNLVISPDGYTFENSLVIPEGFTLNVICTGEPDILPTVTVPEGVTLTLRGSMQFSSMATLTVRGSLFLGGCISGSIMGSSCAGRMTVTGSGTINAAISVIESGILDVSAADAVPAQIYLASVNAQVLGCADSEISFAGFAGSQEEFEAILAFLEQHEYGFKINSLRNMAPVTITSDCTFPANLRVRNWCESMPTSMTIAEGVTLINYGVIDNVSCTVYVNGCLFNSGEINNDEESEIIADEGYYFEQIPETFDFGNATYSLDFDSRTAVFTGPADGFSGELVMPGVIQIGYYGFIVTGIAADAFEGCDCSAIRFIGELTDANYLELLSFVDGKGFEMVQLGVYSGVLHITEDCTIPSCVDFYNTMETDIAAGRTLTNEGTLVNMGIIALTGKGTATIVNNGTLIDDGFIAPGITVVLPRATSLKIMNGDEDVTGNTLEAGVYDTQSMQLSALIEPANASKTLKWTSSSASVASVSADGLVTFLKPGKATITAATTDGSNLKASVTFTATYFSPDVPYIQLAAEGVTLDDGAVLANAGEALTFTIYPYGVSALSGLDARIGSKAAVKYSSSSTAVAAVTANADGSATVKIPAKASGACTIDVVTTDSRKMSASISVYVRDMTPRLDASSVTLDVQKTNEVSVALVESYGNTIESVAYSNENIAVNYENEILTLKANSFLKNQTIKGQLEVHTAFREEPYYLPLNVVVKNSAPSITVKQPAKVNLFYDGERSEALLNVSVKNETIKSITLSSSESFGGTDNGDGSVTVMYNFNQSITKPVTKATLLVELEGYAFPVEKAITIATVTTKPSLKLSPASGTLNTGKAMEIETVISGARDTLSDGCVSVDPSCTFATAGNAGNTVTIIADGSRSGTVKLNVKDDNWTSAMTLSYKLTVSTAKPTAKLGTGTLKFNKAFPDVTAQTTLTTSQGNVAITGIKAELTAVPKNVDKAAADGWFVISHESGTLTAKLLDAAAVNGTYSYTVTPLTEDDELKPVTLKLSVSSSVPKITATAVTLNKQLKETAVSTLKIPAGYTVADVIGLDSNDNIVLVFDAENGRISAELTDTAVSGTYSISLKPLIKADDSAIEAEGAAFTLKVTVKKPVTPTATVSASGKIDAISRSDGIIYTVTKLNNAVGTITGAELVDDLGIFSPLKPLEPNAKGQPRFMLTLKDGVDVTTGTAHRLQIKFTLDSGDEFSSSVLTVKPAQSAMKMSAAAQNCYQSQSSSRAVTFNVNLTSPAGVEIEDLVPGSLTAFKGAICADDITYEQVGSVLKVYVTVRDTSKLVAGKSYKIPLTVTPKGIAANGKPTSLTLTLKVQK